MDFFVITPHKFDPDFNLKRDIMIRISSIYKMESNYASVNRSDNSFDMEATMAKFRHVAFFIADLSYERPSCYFEVGVAQSIGKPVHLIAKASTEIHQVFNRDKVQFYEDFKMYEILVSDILEIH